jgi:hypothetical protein
MVMTLIVDTDDVLALFGASDRDIYAMGTIEDAIYDGTLKPAETDRKTGRWIYGEDDVAMCDGYHCSECGFFVPWDYKRKFIDFIKDYNFCPNCGSQMLKEGEA